MSTIMLIKGIDDIAPTLCSNPTAENVSTNIDTIRNEMRLWCESLDKEMESLRLKCIPDIQSDEESLDLHSVEGNLVFLLYYELDKGQEINKELLFKEAMSILEGWQIAKGKIDKQYLELYCDDERVSRLIDIAINMYVKSEFNSIYQESILISHFIKALDLFDSKNHLNIYRQSFIQVMAYFDSCIFDLAQTCVANNFFEWLPIFAKANQTIKLQDLATYGSFECFQEAQIKELLKSYYVKDVLRIFHDKEKSLFIKDDNDWFPVIMEAVGRRNVHIHHNGKADEKYIEDFNLYECRENEYLKIDRNYVDRIIECTSDIVKSIALTY